MSNLVDVGMLPSNISRVVNAMSQGEGFEEVRPQQVIDFTRHRRNNCGHEFIAIIKYFQEKAETDPEFFFASEVDNAGTLRSIFWADGRTISSYLTFQAEKHILSSTAFDSSTLQFLQLVHPVVMTNNL